MRPRNSTISIPFKRKTSILIVAIAMQMGFNSCSKEAVIATQQSNIEQYFVTNILNSNFRIQLATDNGTDLTSQYDGFTFVLSQYTLLAGPITITKNGVTYYGNWACNSDYSKLTISLPALPPEFVFLNREWKFTKKALPIMEFAPWGNIEPKVLHMEKF